MAEPSSSPLTLPLQAWLMGQHLFAHPSNEHQMYRLSLEGTALSLCSFAGSTSTKSMLCLSLNLLTDVHVFLVCACSLWACHTIQIYFSFPNSTSMSKNSHFSFSKLLIKMKLKNTRVEVSFLWTRYNMSTCAPFRTCDQTESIACRMAMEDIQDHSRAYQVVLYPLKCKAFVVRSWLSQMPAMTYPHSHDDAKAHWDLLPWVRHPLFVILMTSPLYC